MKAQGVLRGIPFRKKKSRVPRRSLVAAAISRFWMLLIVEFFGVGEWNIDTVLVFIEGMRGEKGLFSK